MAKLARRWGCNGTKCLSAGEIAGFIQSVRDLASQARTSKKDNGRTGGYCGDPMAIPEDGVVPHPPGLPPDSGNIESTPQAHQVGRDGGLLQTPFGECSGDTNSRAGMYTKDVDVLDFALPEEQLANIPIGRD